MSMFNKQPDFSALEQNIIGAIEANAGGGDAGHLPGQVITFINAQALTSEYRAISGEPVSMSNVGQILATVAKGFSSSSVSVPHIFMTLSDGLHRFRSDSTMAHSRLNATTFSEVAGLATPVFVPAHVGTSGGRMLVGCALGSGRGLITGATTGLSSSSVPNLQAQICDPVAGLSFTQSMPAPGYFGGLMEWSTALQRAVWLPYQKWDGAAWQINTNDVLFFNEAEEAWAVEVAPESFPAGTIPTSGNRVNLLPVNGGAKFVIVREGTTAATYLFDPTALAFTAMADRLAENLGTSGSSPAAFVYSDGDYAYFAAGSLRKRLQHDTDGAWVDFNCWLDGGTTPNFTSGAMYNAVARSIGNPGVLFFPTLANQGAVVFTGGFSPKSAILAEKL